MSELMIEDKNAMDNSTTLDVHNNCVETGTSSQADDLTRYESALEAYE